MKLLSILAALAISASAVAQEPTPELETVPFVDLERYQGTWYEVAKIPQSFQEGCVDTQAKYKLSRFGFVWVVNSCKRGSSEGRVRKARGIAWVVDKDTNSKLKVSFFPGTAGDYWIIDLDENYQWVVIGSPNRDAFWILSRTKEMDESLYESLILRAESKHGYDRNQIERSF